MKPLEQKTNGFNESQKPQKQDTVVTIVNQNPKPRENASWVEKGLTHFDSSLQLKGNIKQQMFEQLQSELKQIVDFKGRENDKSKLKLLDDRLNSVIEQLGRIGYDVVFNDSETSFTVYKSNEND